MNKPSCPVCGNSEVDKHGTTQPKDKRKKCKPRYRCRNSSCRRTFHTKYTYRACEVGVTEEVRQYADAGANIREISQLLKINKDTVISRLKKGIFPDDGNNVCTDGDHV